MCCYLLLEPCKFSVAQDSHAKQVHRCSNCGRTFTLASNATDSARTVRSLARGTDPKHKPYLPSAIPNNTTNNNNHNNNNATTLNAGICPSSPQHQHHQEHHDHQQKNEQTFSRRAFILFLFLLAAIFALYSGFLHRARARLEAAENPTLPSSGRPSNSGSCGMRYGCFGLRWAGLGCTGLRLERAERGGPSRSARQW